MAEKALTIIKSKLLTEKKELKGRTDSWGKAYPNVELGITMAKGWIGATDEKYRLTINPYWHQHDIHIVETDTLDELENIIRILFGLLNKQKEVKGWKYMQVVRDTEKFSMWTKVEYPASVGLLDEPCAEFKSLQNYIKKYSGYTLPNFYIYKVRMGGKRGVLHSEEGERIYLDNRPKKCAEVLADLRKFRGTKDKMSIKFGKEKWIDPIDFEYSCKHEIECDGEGRSYIQITITSPSGRHKYEQKIF
jgi:hypothetical protein